MIRDCLYLYATDMHDVILVKYINIAVIMVAIIMHAFKVKF